MTNIIPEHRRRPFDAEKAKRGEAVCLALGDIREVGYDPRRKDFPFYNLGEAYDECWTEKGRFHHNGAQSPKDLRMVAPEEPEAVSEESVTPARVDPNTLVPFDEARARKGEAVYLSDGTPFLPWKFDLIGKLRDRVAGSYIENGYEVVGSRNHVSLRMLPKEREKVWVVFSRNECGAIFPSVRILNSREEADSYAKEWGGCAIGRCEIEEIDG